MRSARSLCAGLVLLLAAHAACMAAPEAGREYREVAAQGAPHPSARVEVLEFFYYGCPVCYEAQPKIAAWAARAGTEVVLTRVPAVARDRWETFARAYYALEAMGEIERLHAPIYEHHHFDGEQLGSEAKLAAWLGRNGVDAARFRALLHAPETDARLTHARARAQVFGVAGVPSLVVDGRYVTSARMAGGVDALIGVLDALLERARAERRQAGGG